MNNLSGFLAQNAIKVENIKYVASKRFLGENKKPIPWEIKAITSDEDDLLRKQCTKKVLIPGKKNQYMQETDYPMYLAKLGATCTVFPNLFSVELQDSYSVKGEDILLKTMLNPGEYSDYISKVQEVNGFEISMEELVDEVKN